MKLEHFYSSCRVQLVTGELTPDPNMWRYLSISNFMHTRQLPGLLKPKIRGADCKRNGYQPH